MVTGKMMCKKIVEALLLDKPETKIAPLEIWEASPTGELWHVFSLYEWAKWRLAREDCDT